MADGSINFDTKVDTKGAEEGLKETKKNAQKQISQIEKEINNSGKSVDNITAKYDKLNKKLSDTYAKMDEIAQKTRDANSYTGVVTEKGAVNQGVSDADIVNKLSANTEYQKLLTEVTNIEGEMKKCNEEIRKSKSLQDSLNSSLNTANQELNQMNALETQFSNELSKNDYLSGIKSFEQYKQELSDVTIRMRTIESIAQKISDENISKGIDSSKVNEFKNKLLGANKEYQGLNLKLQALNSSQNKYNNNISKVKSIVSGISSKFGSVNNETQKVKKSTDNFSNSISSGIKRIAKMGLAVLSVQSAYSLLTQCTNNWLNSQDQVAKQITANMQYMQFAIGSMLKPALEGLVTILYKVLSVVASIVNSLFGVNLFANASAKAYSKIAKSASEASESTSKLASFDSLDVLQDDNSSGGSGISTPDFDLSNIDSEFLNLADDLKKLLSSIFEPFKLAWDSTGKSVIDGMENSFQGLKNLGKTVGQSIFEVWTNGTGQVSVENILKIFAKILNCVGNIATALTNAWNNNKNGTAIIQNIWDIFNDILKIIDDIGVSLQNWTVSENFQSALTNLVGFVNEILDYLHQIADWILEMYESYLSPVVDEILVYITDIIDDILKIFETWKPVVNSIVENIENTLEPVVQALSGTLKYIITVLEGIIDFVTGVFTGDFEKSINGLSNIIQGFEVFFHNTVESLGNLFISIFKNAINSIKNFFVALKEWIVNVLGSIGNFLYKNFGEIGTTIADTISSTIKSVVNGLLQLVENKVNSFISMINGAVDIINAIPGVSISYISNIQLPRLAQGAIVNNPGRGVPVIAGEAGSEAILPLEQNTEWMDVLVDKTVAKMTAIIRDALKEMTINLNFDGTLSQFIRLLVKEIDKEKNRTGSQIITINSN